MISYAESLKMRMMAIREFLNSLLLISILEVEVLYTQSVLTPDEESRSRDT